MNFPAISTLLPHAAPMVLLDRVLAADDESLCAEVAIRAHTLFCGAHGVGAWVGVEYMAQAIAAHAGYGAQRRGDPVKVGFLLGARRYECTRPYFTIGSVLEVHIRRTLQSDNGLGAFECHINDAGEPSGIAAATATITVFQPENANDFLQGHSQ
jgi:predicted hotdog family 3-hydroxylacyl-ACP dehydratase